MHDIYLGGLGLHWTHSPSWVLDKCYWKFCYLFYVIKWLWYPQQMLGQIPLFPKCIKCSSNVDSLFIISWYYYFLFCVSPAGGCGQDTVNPSSANISTMISSAIWNIVISKMEFKIINSQQNDGVMFVGAESLLMTWLAFWTTDEVITKFRGRGGPLNVWVRYFVLIISYPYIERYDF